MSIAELNAELDKLSYAEQAALCERRLELLSAKGAGPKIFLTMDEEEERKGVSWDFLDEGKSGK